MIHKGENYSVKMQKYYFCNGTLYHGIKNFSSNIQGNITTDVDAIYKKFNYVISKKYFL